MVEHKQVDIVGVMFHKPQDTIPVECHSSRENLDRDIIASYTATRYITPPFSPSHTNM